MKNGKKLKLGDAHVTPINIQEVQASKLGDARSSPSSSTKYQVIFQCAIFLLLHMICVILGAPVSDLFVLASNTSYINKLIDSHIFYLSPVWRGGSKFSKLKNDV